MDIVKEINPYYDYSNIPHEFDVISSKYITFLGKQLTLYDLLMGFWERKVNLDLIAMIANDIEINSVLDLGVGQGHLLLNLATKFKEATIHGIDFSTGMLNASERYLKLNGIVDIELSKSSACPNNYQEDGRAERCTRIKLIKGDCTCLDSLGQKYDLVVSSFLLDLLPSDLIMKVLEEVPKILNRDGRIYLAILNECIHSSHPNSFKKKYYSCTNRIYKYFYSNVSIRRISHSLFAGYYTHCRPIDMFSYINKSYKLRLLSCKNSSIRIIGIPFLSVNLVEVIKI